MYRIFTNISHQNDPVMQVNIPYMEHLGICIMYIIYYGMGM